MSKEKPLVDGEFSKQEDQYIRDNYMLKTDKQIAADLKRSPKSVTNRRVKLGLMDKQAQKFTTPKAKENRAAYIASLNDQEREDFFRKELKSESYYKQVKLYLDANELQYYEDMFVAFKMDPTIEDMTVMEEQALHAMTIAQIRMNRYMKDERTPDKDGRCYSKSKEIKECEEIIQRYQESLNVQRKQRLKNPSDQAVNFLAIIRELKDPNLRREAGYEAAMLKYIAEQTYNTQSDPDNPERTIFSGREDKFNLKLVFKDGVVPSGLSSEFI